MTHNMEAPFPFTSAGVILGAVEFSAAGLSCALWAVRPHPTAPLPPDTSHTALRVTPKNVREGQYCAKPTPAESH